MAYCPICNAEVENLEEHQKMVHSPKPDSAAEARLNLGGKDNEEEVYGGPIWTPNDK